MIALRLAALTALSINYVASHAGNAHALTHGFHAAFLGGAGIALAGGLAALPLIRAPKAAAAPATAELEQDQMKLAG